MRNDGQIRTTVQQQQERQQQPVSGLLALDSPTLHLRSIKAQAQAQETARFYHLCGFGDESLLDLSVSTKAQGGGMMRKSPRHFKEKKRSSRVTKKYPNEETYRKKEEKINLQDGLLFHAVVMRQERVGSRS